MKPVVRRVRVRQHAWSALGGRPGHDLHRIPRTGRGGGCFVVFVFLFRPQNVRFVSPFFSPPGPKIGGVPQEWWASNLLWRSPFPILGDPTSVKEKRRVRRRRYFIRRHTQECCFRAMVHAQLHRTDHYWEFIAVCGRHAGTRYSFPQENRGAPNVPMSTWGST